MLCQPPPCPRGARRCRWRLGGGERGPYTARRAGAVASHADRLFRTRLAMRRAPIYGVGRPASQGAARCYRGQADVPVRAEAMQRPSAPTAITRLDAGGSASVDAMAGGSSRDAPPPSMARRSHSTARGVRPRSAPRCLLVETGCARRRQTPRRFTGSDGLQAGEVATRKAVDKCSRTLVDWRPADTEKQTWATVGLNASMPPSSTATRALSGRSSVGGRCSSRDAPPLAEQPAAGRRRRRAMRDGVRAVRASFLAG